MALANILGYLFVLVLSRGLGPADFGGFSSLNTLGIVLAIPAGALQIMVASRVARHGPQAFDIRLPLTVGTSVAVVACLFSPLLRYVTRVDSLFAPLVVGVGFIPLTVTAALMGFLLGRQRIRALAAVYLAAGLTRLCAAGISSALSLGVTGTFALVVLASVGTTAFASYLAWDELQIEWRAATGPRWRAFRALARSNSSIGVLVALTSVDVVLARYVLTEVESGQYALVSTLGRAPIWATQFMAFALVPALAKSGSRRSVLRAVGLVLALSLIGMGVAVAAPDFWIGLLGGAAYVDASGLLLPYLVLGTLLAVAQVLVVAEMAQRRHILATLTWAAVGMQIALCLLFLHDNAFQVLLAAAISASLVALVGIAELFFPRKASSDSHASQVRDRVDQESAL